jgi:hypothetical protein
MSLPVKKIGFNTMLNTERLTVESFLQWRAFSTGRFFPVKPVPVKHRTPRTHHVSL